MSFDRKNIEKRTKTLEEARKFLKTQFVGIDSSIDKLVDSVKMWYIMPELQMRPVIVNLWGITGAGKTDLIRKFVNYLDFTDKFCEIQMDSKEGSATIEDYLENTLSNTEPGILLLDEIQRFRSVAETGMENNSSKFSDLWMLLSDGVLQSNAKIKQELLQLMLEEEYSDERNKLYEPDQSKLSDKDKELEEKRKKFKYKMHQYDASRIKKLLKLEESVATIMTYTKEQKMQLIKHKINSKEIYEGKKYNKLLIIISGNLDEAFHVARNVDDADLDADVYHAFSKTIDIVQIKKALTSRFKPEQIARLGNIHIIYPILNKASNYAIIRQKVNLISENIKNIHGVKINFDDSVMDVIYANGVFPVQGVRPLLSTISSIVENSVPIFLFEYLKSEKKQPILISHKGGKLLSVIGGKKISYEIPRVLDDIKARDTNNKLSLVAVHEAGHAVAYAVLNKVCPTQIVASTSDNNTGGFVGTHRTLNSKRDIINDIIISFAGRVAEETIFGKELITSGAYSDYTHATSKLASMVRMYGMDNYNNIYVPAGKHDAFLDSTVEIDNKIEALSVKIYSDCVNLIKANLDFLLAVSEELFKTKKITQENFQAIAQPFIGAIAVVESGEKLEIDYSEILKKAVSKQKMTNRKKSNVVSTEIFSTE